MRWVLKNGTVFSGSLKRFIDRRFRSRRQDGMSFQVTSVVQYSSRWSLPSQCYYRWPRDDIRYEDSRCCSLSSNKLCKRRGWPFNCYIWTLHYVLTPATHNVFWRSFTTYFCSAKRWLIPRKYTNDNDDNDNINNNNKFIILFIIKVIITIIKLLLALTLVR